MNSSNIDLELVMGHGRVDTIRHVLISIDIRTLLASSQVYEPSKSLIENLTEINV